MKKQTSSMTYFIYLGSKQECDVWTSKTCTVITQTTTLSQYRYLTAKHSINWPNYHLFIWHLMYHMKHFYLVYISICTEDTKYSTTTTLELVKQPIADCATHFSPECNTSFQPQERWTFPPEEGGLGLWTLPGLMQRGSEWGQSASQVWGGVGE